MSGSPRFVALAVASAVTLLLGLAVVDRAGAAEDSATGPPPSALATPVLSPRRLPALLASNLIDANIRAALQPALDAALPNTCIVVTDHGRPIVDQGPDVLDPASTAKLLTAVAVLETLDPDSHLRTSARLRHAPSGGVVDGDLYLVGGGDPVLTTPGYEVSFTNRDQLHNDFSQLADSIAAAGIREIRGGIVGDDSRYDQTRWVESWPVRYRNQGFIGPMSALMVNDGQTGYSTSPDDATKDRQPGDPPVLAAQTLESLLEARGVKVTGEASQGRAPDGATEVAGLDSPSIRDLVGQMLIESDDTTAESLTKELGYSSSGEGSTAAGVRVIFDRLRQDGLPLDGVVLNDGSGLDEGNRVNCHLLAAILDRAGPDSELARLLPAAGENGTLRPRMRRTPAQGQVFAKTGTLDHVNALAGYARLANGNQLTFVYDVVGDDQPRGFVPIDEFAVALVTAPAGPDVERLAPKPG
jgi:D-alanyl-D-alanine carboxypeptidase/D-alanyl-D-alanine-endopeptidase (penicillin-binding protein 4)